MADIEGELADEEPTKAVAKAEAPGQVAVFNPLDAEPLSFARNLTTRQDNYDQLQMHLRGVLVPGKDFGKIHVVKNCDDKWNCQKPGHFSGYTLFAPGADKVLGILGLGVEYPDLKDYKRAVLTGHKIEDVLIDCQVLGHNDQVICQGAGAASRKDFNGDLNNTIKRACKRARLDAVMRLPVVSALFESDFLAGVEKAAAKNKGNSTASRAQKIKNAYDTGARLEVCPIGKEIKGKPWHEIETSTLEWLEANVTDKPDIIRAVREELTKRNRAPGPGSISTPVPPDLS